MAVPPSGFVNRPKVRSVAEAVSLDSHDRIVSVAKNALQSYIASFLETLGSNRDLTRVVSPSAMQYVTDKSLQDSNDPNKKPVQLARMYNDIQQRLPAILIVDAGVLWEEPGLGGGLERVASINGKWQGWYRICARINVVVACVTRDPESCSMLQNVLSIFFKQLRNVAGGSRMSSGKEHEYWEVRLPLNFNSTINQPSNVADDPKDQIWASSIEMELQAEDLFSFERPFPTFVEDGYVLNDPNPAGKYLPTIDAPTSVKLSDGPFLVVVSMIGDQHRIVLSDGKIATLDPESMVITPRRTGSFDILVIDTTQDHGNNAPVPWSKKVVTQQTVQVTF